MTDRTPITRGQWLTLAAALLGWFFDGFEMGVFPIAARPALKQLLDTADDELIRQWNAVLTVAFLVGAALGGTGFGWLGDRIGRVKAMAASVLTYALLTGAGGFAQSAWQLAALRFLASLGMGGEWALGVALLAETWPAEKRPLLAGLVGAAANVGYVLVAVISLQLEPERWWRSLFMLCALPAVLTFVLRLFVPESEKWRHATETGPKATLAEVFTGRTGVRAALGACAGAVALLATWGAVQLTQLWAGQLSADKRAGAWVQICSASAASFGALLAPLVLQNVSRRVGYFLLCLVSFVSAQMLFNLHTRFDALFLLNVALVGVCTAAFYGWLPLYLPELFPTRVRAAGQGFCYNAGRALAAAGVLVTTFGIDVRGNYPRASAIVCLVYLVGLGLAWLLPETRGRDLPE